MSKMSQLDMDRQHVERLTDVVPPPPFPKLSRVASTWTPADSLVDKFCSGQINEMEFASRGSIIGMPREEIDGLIEAVRAEDGGLK